MVQALIKERQQNVKHQILISGASRFAYWASYYVIDIAFHQLLSGVAMLSIYYLGIDAPDTYTLLLSFSIVNPVFVYALSWLFETDSQASVLVRVLYFAFGGAAPIAIQVLQVINRECIEWADWLK